MSIVVWMAAMVLGPAIMPWLQRTHGKFDTVFPPFILMYVGFMFCFALYISVVLSQFDDERYDNLPFQCFFDETDLIQQSSLQVLNLLIVSLIIVIVLAIGLLKLYPNLRTKVCALFSFCHKFNTVWVILLAVLFAEIVLFVFVWETANQCRNLLSFEYESAKVDWSFTLSSSC